MFTVQANSNIDDYNGGVARRHITAGEPITKANIVKSTEGGFLADCRKCHVWQCWFIFPGDRVDLIVTHRIHAGGGEESYEPVLASETFVEDVRVVAVDQMLENNDNRAFIVRTVTVECIRRQAEKINVATNLGKVSLSLRSLANEEEVEAEEELYTCDNDISKLLYGNTPIRSRISVLRGRVRTDRI
jgi:pilus assembly protein CpaB